MGDILILTVIGGIALLAVRSLLQGRKKGCCSGCSGCSGHCGSCSGCGTTK